MRVVVTLFAMLVSVGSLPIFSSGASFDRWAMPTASDGSGANLLDRQPHLISFSVPGMRAFAEHYPHKLANELSNLSYDLSLAEQEGNASDDIRVRTLRIQVKQVEEQLNWTLMAIHDDIRNENERLIEERARPILVRLAAEGIVPKHVAKMGPFIHADLTLEQAAAVRAWPDVDAQLNDAVYAPQVNLARRVLRADQMENLGYSGSGTIITVIDSGVNPAHPDLDLEEYNHFTYPLGCYDGSDQTSDHGTLVAGVIGSSDGTLRGIAVGQFLGSIRVTEWNPLIQDFEIPTENIECALDQMAGAGRHYAQMSLGRAAEPINEPPVDARMTDYYAYQYDILEVISAGNWRQRVGAPCNNYNGFCVGGMEDKNTLAKSDDTPWIDEGSDCDPGPLEVVCGTSYGPTSDGRSKPELVGIGQNVRVPAFSGTGEEEVDGTSFSSPMIMGVVGGTLDRLASLNMDARKAILISGAAGRGPTPPFPDSWNANAGWGYPLAEVAVNNVGNGWYMSGSVSEGETDTLSRTIEDGSLVKVALVWRRATDGSISHNYGAANRLEICVVTPQSVRTCWLGGPVKDHVEVRGFCAATWGTYKIEVRGEDVSGSQSYGLAFDKRGGSYC